MSVQKLRDALEAARILANSLAGEAEAAVIELDAEVATNGNLLSYKELYTRERATCARLFDEKVAAANKSHDWQRQYETMWEKVQQYEKKQAEDRAKITELRGLYVAARTHLCNLRTAIRDIGSIKVDNPLDAILGYSDVVGRPEVRAAMKDAE